MNKDWIKKIFAHNLKHLRKEAGLTQAQVAKTSKISFRSYQQLESGMGNPTLDTIERLALAFRLTASRLLQLSSIRMPKSEGECFDKFKRKFDGSHLAVGLRSTDGVALWANQKLEKHSGWNPRNGPFDILGDILKDSPEMRAILRTAMVLERRGFAFPYVVSFLDAQSRDRVCYRAYPTLILPAIGQAPIWVAVYYTELELDCENRYYDFCRELLSLCYPKNT